MNPMEPTYRPRFVPARSENSARQTRREANPYLIATLRPLGVLLLMLCFAGTAGFARLCWAEYRAPQAGEVAGEHNPSLAGKRTQPRLKVQSRWAAFQDPASNLEEASARGKATRACQAQTASTPPEERTGPSGPKPDVSKVQVPCWNYWCGADF